jgi:lipoprotein-releasing system ATP-binding protein
MSPLILIESIGKSFPTRSGTLTVLRDVSFALEKGEAAAIMGPSGSGKSTLLNILGTLESPTSGSLSFDGTNPFDLDEKALARFRNRRIGFVFQEHHLLPQCNVLENVLVPTLASSGNGEHTDRARKLLKRVGLADRLDHRPAELSGGERQRVAVARALINEPDLLLADEPTGNLDRTNAEVVATLLRELHQEEGTTLVVVTHSATLAQYFAQRYEMIDGALAATEGA